MVRARHPARARERRGRHRDGLVDVRAGFTGDRFEVLVYVDNLFEDDTIRTGGFGPDFGKQVTELGFTAGLGQSLFYGVLPPRRQVGVRITARF